MPENNEARELIEFMKTFTKKVKKAGGEVVTISCYDEYVKQYNKGEKTNE